MKDRFRILSAFGLALALSLVGISSSARADTTETLPKGRSMVTLSGTAVDVTREFDNHGHDRELGYYFNKQNITNLATPYFNLYLISQGVPIAPNTPGTVNLARTYLDAKVDANVGGFAYQYGVTDNLTFAVGFPYYSWVRTKADFSVALYPNTAMLPMLPSVVDMTDQAQGILKSEFGYDPIKDWVGVNGMGDLQAGVKWRFLNTDYFQAATGVGVRFPTGRVDDERNLTDVAYGLGGYDAKGFAMVDVTPIPQLRFNFTGRYTYSFPYDRAIYMLDPSQPEFYKAELPTERKFGSFDRGDYFELEHETQVTLAPGVKLFGGMNYLQSQSDTIGGDLVPHTVKLERAVFGGIEVSSVESFQNGSAPIPMSFKLYGDAVQSGRNTEKPMNTYATLNFFF